MMVGKALRSTQVMRRMRKTLSGRIERTAVIIESSTTWTADAEAEVSDTH